MNFINLLDYIIQTAYMLHEYDILIPADTTQNIGRIEYSVKIRRNILQHLITEGLTHLVIKNAEVVHIHRDQSRSLPVIIILLFAQIIIDKFTNIVIFIQLGKRVSLILIRSSKLQFLAVIDVLKISDNLGGIAAIILPLILYQI